MSYACTAGTERKARCRNTAEPHGDWFCTLHNNRKDAGETVEKAPAPDTVLYKFNLNSTWKARMIELGVPEKARDVEAEEAKHVAHAEKFGREAYAIRKDVADSGVPVFGKEGLENVSLFKVFKELAAVYEIVDIHIKPRRDHKTQKYMSVLVVSFSHGEKAAQDSEAFQELMSLLASDSWGFVHVWANPPQTADGKIVHTVNTSHRQQDTKAEQSLHFAHGLWSADPIVE